MKERLLTYLFPVFMVITTVAVGQDRIILINGDKVSAYVTEVRLQEVAYKKADNPEGPLYIIPKQQIYMIQYANGTKEVFSFEMNAPSESENYMVSQPARPSENLYLKGKTDAGMFYNKRGSMWGTFGATIVFAPVGLATGIVLGVVPPKIEDTVPNYQLLEMPEYKKGYVKKAKGKKWGAVAMGFGLGIATNIIVYSLINN